MKINSTRHGTLRHTNCSDIIFRFVLGRQQVAASAGVKLFVRLAQCVRRTTR